MRFQSLCALWLIPLTGSLVKAYNDPIANLDYGSFQGKYDETYNLSYFRKIPYAAPPVGENRFRAPQPPFKIPNGIYDTDQGFDMCPQRTVNGSEDCLYLGLFSRPWNSHPAPHRPVLVVFHGGAFVQGEASFELLIPRAQCQLSE
jgi:carboxylesterase type B